MGVAATKKRATQDIRETNKAINIMNVSNRQKANKKSHSRIYLFL